MNLATHSRLFLGLVLLVTSLAGRSRAADAADAAAPPVVINEDAATFTLANGVVSLTVSKANANLLSLRFGGEELLSRGGGYWNLYGRTPGQKNTQEKPTPSVCRVTRDPARNGGELGEIAILFPYKGQPDAVPMDIEIRYTLHRGDRGVYGWTIADHAPQYPPFNVEVCTVCLKLNPDIFDFLSVDARRQRLMATPEDWVKGTQLNLWEARRLNTGVRKGEVEHKYDYAATYSQTPAWGWSSTKRNLGLFIVNPSLEYLNGGPTVGDITGHLDVKASLPADPTLLFVWHTPHYGGRGIQIKAGEPWRKIVGPFLLYCNAADGSEALWKDALTRAEREQKAWPYDWADAPGYEHAEQRGSATGKLLVRDPQAPAATAAGAWVGLAHPQYEADLGKGPITIDWQTDGKHYQYWAKADPDGRFTIPNVRAGVYTLYAFTDGVLGEFSRADMNVEAGRATDLGELAWVPVRYGRQLWEIGVPDRTAGEFRHGDHYWQWGLYDLYPQEFPQGVDFVVGKSDWKRDWNYAQPPVPDDKGGWKDSTWRIRFDLDHATQGTATLRLAICGARGGPVDVAVNSVPVGGTGELPESGVMHRDGIRGVELYRDIRFDAALLKPGQNSIELTKHARTWTDGVLYDYLRLELDSNKAFSP
jgi:rhamnogalacturonan endolyase